jgi:predicted RNA-binding protein Jag
MGPEAQIFVGKTLDDAVRKGLDELGLSRAEVMITVVEEGSSGFLGLGSRPYKVRMMARPGGAIHEPEAERESERRRRGGRERDRGGRDRGRGRRDERRTGGSRREDEGRRATGRSEEPRGERPAGPSDRPREARAGEGRGRDARPSDRPREPRERDARAAGRGDDRRSGRRGARGSREGVAREERPREEEMPLEARDQRLARPGVAQPPGAMVADDDGAASADDRPRRRRGRRGGRRRRREGGVEMAAPVALAPGMEGTETMTDEMEDMGSEGGDEGGFESVAAPEAAPEPVRESRGPIEPREPRYEREPRPERDRDRRRDRGDEGPGLTPDQLAAEATRWTENLLRAMGFDAKVAASAEDTRVDVTAIVQSDDDLLTGPKGEVRQALQHLLNRMVNRGEGSRYHLQLEINDFWKRREEELIELGRALADEALRTSNEVVTEYLNAQERRIIHVTLKEDGRVKTYALGTGLIKRVAIAPADFPERPAED